MVVLRKRIETLLFYSFSLAPRFALLDRSLDALKADPDWHEMSGPDLVEAWESEVHRLRHQFTLDPDSWTDDETVKFRRSCGLTFGCRGQNVTRLLLEFHSLPDPRRLAILVLLERSQPFNYIIEQVDNCEPMPVENATESLQLLMRRVWGN